MPVLSVEVEAKKVKGVDIEAVFARQINRKTFTMTVADRDLTVHDELADRALGIKLITTLLETKSGLRASDVDVKGMVRALGPYDLDIKTIDPDTRKAKNQYRCTVELEAVRGTDPTKRAGFKPVRKIVSYIATPFLQKSLDPSILTMRRLGVNMQVGVDPAPDEATLKPVRDAMGVVVVRWQKEWTDRLVKLQEELKATLNRDPTLLKDAKKQVEQAKESLFSDMETISKEVEQATDKALTKLAGQPNLSYLKTAKVKADPSWFFAGLQMGPKIAVHAESKVNLGALDELKTDLKKAVDELDKVRKKEKLLQTKIDKALKITEDDKRETAVEAARPDAIANQSAAKETLERLKKMSKAIAKVESELKTGKSPKAAEVGAYRKQIDALAPIVRRWRDASGRLEECLGEEPPDADDVNGAMSECMTESDALAKKLDKLLPVIRQLAPKK